MSVYHITSVNHVTSFLGHMDCGSTAVVIRCRDEFHLTAHHVHLRIIYLQLSVGGAGVGASYRGKC